MPLESQRGSRMPYAVVKEHNWRAIIACPSGTPSVQPQPFASPGRVPWHMENSCSLLRNPTQRAGKIALPPFGVRQALPLSLYAAVTKLVSRRVLAILLPDTKVKAAQSAALQNKNKIFPSTACLFLEYLLYYPQTAETVRPTRPLARCTREGPRFGWSLGTNRPGTLVHDRVMKTIE